MSAPDSEPSPSRFREPKESRRWLQPPVSKERPYRLGTALPTRKWLGARDFWDRLRGLIRAWWVWLALSLLLWERGIWPLALLGGMVSLALYHTSPGGCVPPTRACTL